jgi:hypothetical protein
MLRRFRLILVLFLPAVSLFCASPAPEPTGAARTLAPEQVETFASLALACIDTPYPYKTGHVLTGPESLQEPAAFHPVFFGCFDWHSAVHGHWMLVRLLRLHPDHPSAGRIRSALDAHLGAEPFAREAAFFDLPMTRSFERPYGWAWLLQLASELRTWDDPDAARWASNLEPLESTVVARYETYLPALTWPIRTGVHPNTAFALSMALDYARAVGNRELEDLVVQRAGEYYAGDRRCPVEYEPSGEDFFSPCLLEADLMRRVMPEEEFRGWLRRFLPGTRDGDLGGLSSPATVSDPSDPKIVHLDGLNLVRGWTLDGIASALPAGDRRRGVLLDMARQHADTGLERVASGHYEGEHWLASFAVYMATGAGL